MQGTPEEQNVENAQKAIDQAQQKMNQAQEALNQAQQEAGQVQQTSLDQAKEAMDQAQEALGKAREVQDTISQGWGGTAGYRPITDPSPNPPQSGPGTTPPPSESQQ